MTFDASAFSKPPAQSGTTGGSGVVVGPVGSNYPIGTGQEYAYFDTALAAAVAAGVFPITVAGGPYNDSGEAQVQLTNPATVITCAGSTVVNMASGRVVDLITTFGYINPLNMDLSGLTFNYSGASSAISGSSVNFSGGSPVTATASGTPEIVVLTSDTGVTWTSIQLTPSGGSTYNLGADAKTSAAIAKKGVYLNVGDALTFTWSAGTPVAKTFAPTAVSFSTGVGYTVTADGWITATISGGSYSGATITPVAGPNKGVATSFAASAAQINGYLSGQGLFVRNGDVVTLTFSGTVTAWWCASQLALNLTALGYMAGAETGAPVFLTRMQATNGSGMGYTFIGQKPSGWQTDYPWLVLLGCEDSVIDKCIGISYLSVYGACNNGRFTVIGSKLSVQCFAGDEVSTFGGTAGSDSLLLTSAGPNATQTYDLHGQWFNGSQGFTPSIVCQVLKASKLNFHGGQLTQANAVPGTASGGSADPNVQCTLGGSGINLLEVAWGDITVVQGSAPNGTPLFAPTATTGVGAPPLSCHGNLACASNANLTNAQLITNLTYALAGGANAQGGMTITRAGTMSVAFPLMTIVSGSQSGNAHSTNNSTTLTSCGINSTTTAPTFSPIATGKVRITVSFQIANGTAADGAVAQIGYTTGTLTPGTTTIGSVTALGQSKEFSGTLAGTVTMTLTGIVTGLSNTSTYKFDVFIGDVTSTGVVTLSNADWNVEELSQ